MIQPSLCFRKIALATVCSGLKGEGQEQRQFAVLWSSWDEAVVGKGSRDPVCPMAKSLNMK